MLEEHADTNLNILITWIKMYAADSIDKAKEAAGIFGSDARVTQFYDPDKVSGLALAEGLGAKSGEVAWDVYLFFAGHDLWVEQLPPPTDWVHQLAGSSWAGPDRLYRGEQLTYKLREIMGSLIQDEWDG
jgi:hypothetical protein